MEIIVKDISEKKKFKKEGHLFEMVEDYGHNIYLFHRMGYESWSGKNTTIDYGYELVVGVPYTNTDGTFVHRYPSSNEWGRYGWTFKDREGKAFKAQLKKLLEKYA